MFIYVVIYIYYFLYYLCFFLLLIYKFSKLYSRFLKFCQFFIKNLKKMYLIAEIVLNL